MIIIEKGLSAEQLSAFLNNMIDHKKYGWRQGKVLGKLFQLSWLNEDSQQDNFSILADLDFCDMALNEKNAINTARKVDALFKKYDLKKFTSRIGFVADQACQSTMSALQDHYGWINLDDRWRICLSHTDINVHNVAVDDFQKIGNHKRIELFHNSALNSK